MLYCSFFSENRSNRKRRNAEHPQGPGWTFKVHTEKSLTLETWEAECIPVRRLICVFDKAFFVTLADSTYLQIKETASLIELQIGRIKIQVMFPVRITICR